MTRVEYEPRSSRFAVNYSAVVVHADGTETAVTIKNISERGFRLKATEALARDQRVLFRGETGDVPAYIQWSIGYEAGGVYLKPDD